MKTNFKSRKSIISLILMLSLICSVFMMPASAVSAISATDNASPFLTNVINAIAEEQNIFAEDIEIVIISIRKLTADDLAAVQGHASLLNDSSTTITQNFASSACCGNPNLYYVQIRQYDYTPTPVYCYTWINWDASGCWTCGSIQALWPNGTGGGLSHSGRPCGWCGY